MLGRIFDPNNAFFRPIGTLVDIVALSLLWAMCSLPLVTLGPATAALYDVTVKCLRKGASGPYARFFQVFRENLKTGAAAGLVVLALTFVLVWTHGYIYPRAVNRGVWYSLYFAFWVIAIAITGIAGYILPVLSRFEFRLGGLLANCFRLAMVHLPSTALVGVLLLAGILSCWLFWWPVFFVPCLCSLLVSFPLERIFKPYMKE